MIHRVSAVVGAVFGFSLATIPVAAQSETASAAACEEAAYRAFDFWVGDWTVATPDGDKAGDNLITVEEGGCLILERWSSVSGGTGQSYNYYDPAREAWRQVWVSSTAVIDYEGGLTDAGEMVLEGEIAYRTGVVAPFRGIWTPLDDGRVRQHFDQYDAEKKEWTAWFTGIYTKKAAP